MMGSMMGKETRNEMPKKVKELSALEVQRIREEGMHPVGGVPGLYLQVVGGSRSWILRAMIGGRRRDMGLGSYPGTLLAAAREKAREAKNKIAQGIDPIGERQQAQAALRQAQSDLLTFAAAVPRFIQAKGGEWRNAKHRQQWENTLETYAVPVLGPMPLKLISQEHVMRVLDPIWLEKNETASRVRGRIEVILDWAKAQGFRAGENPARWRGHLDMLLPKPSKVAKVEHQPAVQIDEMPAFMADLRERQGYAARALEFVILTASRSGEVRGALWSEIDLAKNVWNIPAERMKAERPHRVALSGAAVDLLRALPRLEGTDLVFPGMKLGRPLSDMALTVLMRQMDFKDAAGRVAVPHGCRSTFRDWVAERTNYPADLAEMALAHAIGDKTEAAYRRLDMIERRREMMDAWALHCRGEVGASIIRLERKGLAA